MASGAMSPPHLRLSSKRLGGGVDRPVQSAVRLGRSGSVRPSHAFACTSCGNKTHAVRVTRRTRAMQPAVDKCRLSLRAAFPTFVLPLHQGCALSFTRHTPLYGLDGAIRLGFGYAQKNSDELDPSNPGHQQVGRLASDPDASPSLICPVCGCRAPCVAH